MYAGEEIARDEQLPPNVSPVDLTQGLASTRVHVVSLSAGDCVYVPSHWWYQIEVPSDPTLKKNPNSLIVTLAYSMTSTWVDLVNHGI